MRASGEGKKSGCFWWKQEGKERFSKMDKEETKQQVEKCPGCASSARDTEYKKTGKTRGKIRGKVKGGP